MKTHELRELILNKPSMVSDLLLTRNAAELVKRIIRNASATTVWLSEMRGISIQNASRQLHILYLKGYLEREETIQESGGVEYIYKTTLKIRE